MGAHCHDHGCDAKFDGVSPRYRRVLWLVIALNAGMFLIEILAGVMAGSMSLQADALDFIGDAATYGLTLYMIGKPLRWRAWAALIKGGSLALLGAYVVGATIHRSFGAAMPEPFVMGAVGFLALAVNVGSAVLLYRYREGDANVRSVWLCSRNDAIGNIAVLIAALGVFGTNAGWPDLVVAGAMAALFLSSSFQIIRQARRELRHARSAAELAPAE